MVEYRLTRKRKAPAAPAPAMELPVEQEIPEQEQASMLSKAGGAAMSGLHTLGSVLSWPSRLLHGGINAATGGEGGFGENYLNPLDSTGGIEGSQHLIRAGLLAKNDPTKWEWSDLSRGVADMALDPTTYFGGLGLTKKGIQSLKAGTKGAGLTAQIAKGERAIVSGGIPFIAPNAFHFGTGPGVAKAMETFGRKTGVTAAKEAIAASKPVAAVRAAFDATVRGLTHPTLQKLVPDAVKKLGKANRGTKADVIRAGRSELGTMDPDLVRMQLEGVAPSKIKGYAPSQVDAPFDETHEFMHLSPKAVAEAMGEELPDAGNHLDDLISAGAPINAPYIHMTEDGRILTGGKAGKQALKQARRQYREQIRQLDQRINNIPATTPSLHARILAAMDQIHPEAGSGALISARDIRRALPDVPKAELDRAILELAGDMPANAAASAAGQLSDADAANRILEAMYRVNPRVETGDIASIGDILRQSGVPPEQANRVMMDMFRNQQVILSRISANQAGTTTPLTDLIRGEDGTFYSMAGLWADEAGNMPRPTPTAAPAPTAASPRHVSAHLHDFAANLPQDQLDELVDTAAMYPERANMPANQGRYVVGISKNSNAPAPNFPEVTNPMRASLEQQKQAAKRAKQQTIRDAEQAILQDIHAQHGADEGVMTLSKLVGMNEPLAGFMVPRSQKEDFLRRFGKGKADPRDAGLSHHEIDALKGGAKSALERQIEAGVGTQSGLQDVVNYFPRQASFTSETKQSGRIAGGSKVMPGKTAEDVGRQLGLKGNWQGTVGVNKILGDEEIHDAIAAAGGDWKAAVPLISQKYGHTFERLGQGAKHQKVIARHEKALGSLNEKLANVSQKKANLEELVSVMQGSPQLPRLHQKIGKAIDSISALKKKIEATTKARDKALVTGIDRNKYLAKLMANNPDLRGKKLFGNDPLVDYSSTMHSVNKKVEMSQPVYSAISQHMNEGDQGVKLGDFLRSAGYSVRQAAEKIANKSFDSAEDLKGFLNNTIDSKFAEQLKSLTPRFTKPEAINQLQDMMKTGMSWWKALTLAFPASRVRDAVGGAVQNMLHGWADPRFLMTDANALLSGKVIKRDYSHVPEIQEWLEKSRLPWSPENQTEAMRQLIAVYLPSEFGVLGDVPVGQTGAGIDQILHNVPGTKPTSFTKQFFTDPAKTLLGKGDTGATWFGKGEPGDSFVQRAGKAAAHPFTGVRGVGDATETTFAPVRASEQVSAASDAYNRAGPFMQMLHGGYSADAAADAVNRAQVDYSPETFTAFERGIKNNWLPFYCVPVDHEILTRDGWKFYQELTIGEEVMAYDLPSGGLHWTPLKAVNVYDFDGELNVFRQTRRGNGKTSNSAIEFLFTDDHRWPTITSKRAYKQSNAQAAAGLAVKHYAGLRRFCRGADLQSQHQIPHSGTYHADDNEKSVLNVRLAKILGWVVTYGYHRWRGNHLEMMVYQSPSKFLDDIIELLGTKPRTPHPETGVVCVPVAHEDVVKIKEVFTSKSDMPRIVSRLSPDAAEAMWQVMMDAEGSDNKVNTPHFSQCGPNGKPIKDAFQILCLMTGRSANISSIGCYVKKSKSYWIHDCLSKRNYTGKIWCPTTGYGTWVMRHNGAMIITGNSFNSRILPETARQLADPRSPTAQMVKALDRAHGGGDPSVPDYVLAGTGIPLGQREDGSKAYATGFGLMHEPAVSTLGLLAGGNFRPAAYDLAAQLNPAVGIPLQRMTGQSFFQRGEPLANLDPTTGRLISNIGESLGIRDPELGPVRYPGSTAVDALLGATPFGRLANQARGLADPRKDIGSKLVDTLSGARITDISPSKQLSTLQKRAEDLARSEGAFESRMVGFPKSQIAQLAKTDPEAAARQQHLQNMITMLKRRKIAMRKQKEEAEGKPVLTRKKKAK